MEVIHWPGRRRRNVGGWHCQRFKTVGIKYWHWTGQARTNLFREANSLDRKELACVVFLRESCTKRINQWFYFSRVFKCFGFVFWCLFYQTLLSPFFAGLYECFLLEGDSSQKLCFSLFFFPLSGYFKSSQDFLLSKIGSP